MMSVLARAALNTTATPGNSTGNAVQVVCAFPVSGQYGPGSRILYYVLVAVCVFGRKAAWLRNACLAVALVFPAVAAIHGLVLASVHVNGAVDMDVYGAFQLCSIGILAAPLTVRISRTYFNDPGRNTIFLWTGLVLAGLLSLTVEFYRATPISCNQDDNGKPLPKGASNFPYGQAQCGLVCSEDDGPFSPMRGGAASNIYVIPAPTRLTFNTAFLMATACCLPALLSLAFTTFQILDENWKRRTGQTNDEQLIIGTNGATDRQMKGINSVVRLFLSVIEVPLFGAAVIAILIIGEINFFSSQVRYQTEPFASVGQWGPIAGTVLAAIGSLYLLLTGGFDSMQVEQERDEKAFTHHCNCSHHSGHGIGRVPTVQINSDDERSPSRETTSSTDEEAQGLGIMNTFTNDLTDTLTRQSTDAGSRRAVRRALTTIGNKLGAAAHQDVDEFKQGKARDFPIIPGEFQRNPDLPRKLALYNPPRDADGNVTPDVTPQLRPTRSITSLSGASDMALEGSPSSPRAGRRRDTLETKNESVAEGSSSSPRLSYSPKPARRRDTLEVPAVVHHRTGSG